MKKHTLLLLFFSWSACVNYSDNTELVFLKIRELNQQMESLYDDGNSERLAEFYTEEAIVFGPNDQLNGRSNIKKYWEKINSPVSLSLEILDLRIELDSLNFIQKNRAAKKEIPPAFINQLNENANHVFQLTKTTLAYEREDVTFSREETISLINWEEQPEGHYQIKAVWLMDTLF